MEATVLDIALGNLKNQEKTSIRIRKKTSPRISDFISKTFWVLCPVIVGNNQQWKIFVSKFHASFGHK